MLNHTLLITMETFKQPVKTSSNLLSSLFETFVEHILLALFNPFLAAKEGWWGFVRSICYCLDFE